MSNLHGAYSQRSRQKDPSKSPSLDLKAAWSKLEDSPQKAVGNSISPKMVAFDRQACDSIVSSLNRDKELEGLQKEFVQHNRAIIRQKLKERRGQIDGLHMRAS
jgi:hypothetical protein